MHIDEKVKKNRRTPRRYLVSIATSVALLSACTTVSRTSLVSGAGGVAGAGDAVSGGVAGSNAGDAGAGQQGSSSGPGGAAGANADLTAGQTGGVATPGGARSIGSAGGKGATPGTSCRQVIKIGYSISTDVGAGLAAAGHPEFATNATEYKNNQAALFQRVADDINGTGGLAGCNISVVPYDFKALSGSGFSAESQNECVYFAEDQHVFAVVPQILETQTLLSCLAQHKVVALYPGYVYQPNRQDFAEKYHGFLYMPGRISSYRFGPDIDLLAQAGFFGPGAKLGILLADDGSGNSQHVVNDLWKPKLAALGITPVVFTYTQVQSNADVSRDSAQFQSAVLQFKAAGVNRMMFTPDEGVGGLFFTQVADSQGFRPRYGLNSYNSPATWSGEPAGQRPGAIAVTFSIGDLGNNPSPAQTASNPPSPNRARCDGIYKGHMPAGTPLEAMYVVCDRFFFLQAALKGATGASPQALLAGADSLGTSFPLADGFSNSAIRPPDRYDGAASVRVMKWNEGALQWEYAGAPIRFP